MKTLIICLGIVVLVTAGCVTRPATVNRLRIPHNTAIVIPPEATAGLMDLPVKSRAIKTGSAAGKFALNIAPYTTEIGQGPNEVRIRNANTFPVLVMLRTAENEKGLNLEFPPKSISTLHLPNGGYQISYIFSTIPNATYRGDYIRVPALTRPEIGIPVSAGK